jgi:hypothetical protein
MLVAPSDKVARNTDIKRPVPAIRHQIDVATNHLFLMPGHSRPKDGVLSHAYVPGIHVILHRLSKARRG